MLVIYFILSADLASSISRSMIPVIAVTSLSSLFQVPVATPTIFFTMWWMRLNITAEVTLVSDTFISSKLAATLGNAVAVDVDAVEVD